MLGLDLASLATQGVGAEAQPNAYTGYGINVVCANNLTYPDKIVVFPTKEFGTFPLLTGVTTKNTMGTIGLASRVGCPAFVRHSFTQTTMKRRDFLHSSAAAAAASFVTFDSLSAAESKPKLQFAEGGKFKIAQFTDTHYDSNKKEDCIEAVRMIEETFDAEKPQCAVYTGDIVVAGNTQEGWNDILAPCIERKIPYAVVLGNHDNEHTRLSRREIIEYVSGLPFSVTQLGPENVFGASNYVLEIFDGDNIANLLYCLDSNAYPQPPFKGAYDWFHDDQIAWLKKRSEAYTKQSGNPIPALAFFHIPLCEYGEMIHHQAVQILGNVTQTRKDNRTNMDTAIAGQRFEMECPGSVNSGMFYAMWLQKDVMGIFVGHDHVNDYVGLFQGIALGYGRWSGTKTTYGSKQMTHGARLIELSKDGGRSFKTWIRQRGGQILFDVQVPEDLVKKS